MFTYIYIYYSLKKKPKKKLKRLKTTLTCNIKESDCNIPDLLQKLVESILGSIQIRWKPI